MWRRGLYVRCTSQLARGLPAALPQRRPDGVVCRHTSSPGRLRWFADRRLTKWDSGILHAVNCAPQLKSWCNSPAASVGPLVMTSCRLMQLGVGSAPGFHLVPAKLPPCSAWQTVWLIDGGLVVSCHFSHLCHRVSMFAKAVASPAVVHSCLRSQRSRTVGTSLEPSILVRLFQDGLSLPAPYSL